MPEEKNELASNEDLVADKMNINNSCRDMTLVTDGKFLEDGIVELTDKDKYMDEP